MSIQIKHPGIGYSADLDATKLTGDAEADYVSAYIQSLKAGRLVVIGANGLALADGATDQADGVLATDAGGEAWTNRGALAGGKQTIQRAQPIYLTTEKAPGIVFKRGDKIYAGTGDNVGLHTNVAPVAEDATKGYVGKAGADCGASDSVLEVLISAF